MSMQRTVFTRKTALRLWLPAMAVVFFAVVRCGIFFGSNQVDNKNHGYQIVELDKEKNSPWRSVQKDESDHAFENQSNGSIVTVNSVCGEHRGRPIEELLEDLFLGLRPAEPPTSKEITLDGERAVEATIEPKETDSLVRAIVMRKGLCTFDLMFIGTKRVFHKEMHTFDRFLKGFHVRKDS